MVCDVINDKAVTLQLLLTYGQAWLPENDSVLQWQMKRLISGTMPPSESHTGDNLVIWIKEMVDGCSISKERIVA